MIYVHTLDLLTTGMGVAIPQNTNTTGEINLPSANMQNSVCGVINSARKRRRAS